MHEFKHAYCPRYCEENVWHLCQNPCFSGTECVVAVISNVENACLFWNQRVSEHPDVPVWWDYHVILFARREAWMVYDLDSALALPVEAGTYLRRTFRLRHRMPDPVRPRFLLWPAEEYVREFSSDRSHMRGEDGSWFAPPPEWPAIWKGKSGGFVDFLNRHLAGGRHLSWEETVDQFEGTA